MHEVDVYYFENKKRSIEPGILLAMIDLASQTRSLIKSLGYTPNENSNILYFRRILLRFCLESEDYPADIASYIVRQIKTLNLKLRCFGIFKVRNRKQWKITIKTLRAILTFDDIIVEKDVKLSDERTKSTVLNDQQIIKK